MICLVFIIILNDTSSEKTLAWFPDVFSGFLAQHPRQLVVLWTAWRMDGRAGGRRGGGRASAGHTEVTSRTLYWYPTFFSIVWWDLTWFSRGCCSRLKTNIFILFLFSGPVFLQDDLSSAQRKRPAATVPVGHAAWYPRQRPREPDDQFQSISVHRSQHALASWSAL